MIHKHLELNNYLIVDEADRNQLESAVLSMEFKVKKHHVHNGRIHVK